MAAKAKFTLEILATAKKAVGEFNKLKKNASEVFGGIAAHARRAALAIAALGTAALLAARKQQQAEMAAIGQLKAMGAAAQWNIEYLKEQADKLQDLTTISDDLFIAAGAVMGTFRNLVREELPRALQLTADFTKIYGGDLVGNAKQIGRILSGYTDTLSRFGIILTDQQKALQKGLLTHNKQLEANAYMMSLLEAKMGKASQEFAKSPLGKLDTLKNRAEDALQAIGKVLAQEIVPAVQQLSEILKDVEDFFKKWNRNKQYIAEWIRLYRKGGLTPISAVGAGLQTGFFFEPTEQGAGPIDAVKAMINNAKAWLVILKQYRAEAVAQRQLAGAEAEQIAGRKGMVVGGGLRGGLRDIVETPSKYAGVMKQAGEMLAKPAAVMGEQFEITFTRAEEIWMQFYNKLVTNVRRISDAFVDWMFGVETDWRRLLMRMLADLVKSGLWEAIKSLGKIGGPETGTGGGLGGILGGIAGAIISIIPGLGGPSGVPGPNGMGGGIRIITSDPAASVRWGRNVLTADNYWTSELTSPHIVEDLY